MQPASFRQARGFTLLELIIVIAILAILSVAVVLVINPAETLKRARDSQRLSDMSAIKSAIGLYLSDKTGPQLDNGAAAGCLDTGTTNGKIYYSLPTSTAIGDATRPAVLGTDASGDQSTMATNCAGLTPWCIQVVVGSLGAVDGTGWIPVKLTDISSGSPLGNFPIDPSNNIAYDNPEGAAGASAAGTVTTDALVYRYACVDTGAAAKPSSIFEADATLESKLYATTNNNDATDGGDNADVYESGNSLRVLPTGQDF